LREDGRPWHTFFIVTARKVLEQCWWLILLGLLGAAVFLCAAIPRLDINSNTDAFIEEDSPEVAVYYETREDWGTDEFAVVCVTAEDWFTPEGMARLQEIEADLLAVEFVQSTMSILDVPLLRQEPEKKPKIFFNKEPPVFLGNAGVDLEAAKREHQGHKITEGNLISADGRSLNVLAYLDWRKQDGKLIPPINERRTLLVQGVRKVAEKWNGRLEEPVRLSGVPMIQITLFENMRADLIVFGVASLLLFTLSFALVYRRWRFVVIPMLCCLLPPVMMVGGMAYLGISIGFVTSNMPVLLFVLMLPYSVYFIEAYRERRAAFPEEDGLASSLEALRVILLPCLFSCATTLAGFVALGASKVIPIRDFGQAMTVGMALGFVVVFLFIAGLSRLLPGLKVQLPSEISERKTPAWVRVLERLTLGSPKLVVGVSLLILGVSLLGVWRISAESKFSSYFWPHSEVYQGLEFIDSEMGGTTWVEVVLKSEEEGYFRKKKGLRALEVVEEYFHEVPETGNIMSLISLRDEIRKTFRSDWFPLLSDGILLTQIAKQSPELVGQTTSKDFKTSRITVRMMETAPTLNRQRILDGLDVHLKTHEKAFGDVKIDVTGIFPVYAELLQQLMTGQRQSVVWVAGAVFLMLLVLFRSPVLSLLILVSQMLPAAVVLGLIGWLGIPLDLVTVMIAAIAIGVGIDAAIQYTMRFRRELAETGDLRRALHRAHATIGRAIWIATSIIVVGFIILVLSKFFPSVWFGLFTALAMLIGQLATLTVLPSLFLLTGYPKSPDKGGCGE
jgi:predicted RND superfamily exporter protein